jgi:hypothetical protein
MLLWKRPQWSHFGIMLKALLTGGLLGSAIVYQSILVTAVSSGQIIEHFPPLEIREVLQDLLALRNRHQLFVKDWLAHCDFPSCDFIAGTTKVRADTASSEAAAGMAAGLAAPELAQQSSAWLRIGQSES